ncbi:dephospho-CoA kinase [Carboxylicivirga sp. A043]|uniref:dephospho-CoA kinase n=1 Tax=Carboxylicivirga litoralis TaxID=2816963 RepID=UPI0021CB38C5|nr:dephospho-CoA kinase [Carboxylicivirga sp. A043]MCU4158005.1 dephospho-CoA kinase [Carboxylicivirga sp. A043]
MIKVGLTGGIGSGKSTVVKLIRFLGYPVYVADIEAKNIIHSDETVRQGIIELLGEKAYNSDGYNVKYVAQKVFSNKSLLEGLNAIVHPAVHSHFNAWCELNKDKKIVFQEAAILFENGSYTKFDKTILVTASKQERVARVMRRDDLSEAEVNARMSKQWEDTEKLPLADYNVKCDGEHLVIPQVLEIIKQIQWDC